MSYLIQDVPAGLHEIRARVGYWPGAAGTTAHLMRADLTIIATER